MILKLLLTALLLLFPASSWAAIAYVSHTEAATTSNVASISYSQVVGAGADRALVVCSSGRHGTNPAKQITGITFNGSEAFTLIRRDTRTVGVQFITELWVLANPTVTTANIVVTYSAANDQYVGVSSTLFTGVSQTSPVDSSAGANGISTAPSAVITTVADNAAIIDCVRGRGNSGLTVGAGQTVRSDRLMPAVEDGVGVSTVVPKTPAGAETMNWTQTAAEEWAITVASLTPSGGSDPPPVVPSQVTLGWTNGTDPGNPASGITNTSIRRSTGVMSDATIAPVIASVTYPLTSYVDTTVQPNTTYGYSVFHTDGVGLTSPSHATVRVTTSVTPPPTPPTIANVAFDNTGVTITPGAVTPTKVKIWTFTDQRVVTSVISTWASLVAGRFDQTWFDGLQGACVSAIGPTDLENLATNAYLCVNLINLGLVLPLDITPPTLTCPTTINLPYNASPPTSWTFSCTVNKPNTAARFETSDTTYALMANTMTSSPLTFAGTVTGLTNNSTTTRYVRGTTLHPFEIDSAGDPFNYPNTTSYAVVINVAAAAGDVIPPGDVAGLSATLLGTSVSFTWTHPATDAVNYQLYQSTGACSTYIEAGQATAPPMTVASLEFGLVYCWKMKALDVVNNMSVSFSNIVTVTTPAAPDAERPSDMGSLTVTPFRSTILLTWPFGTDNSFIVFGNIEYCLVETGQMDCANFDALVSQISQTFLTPVNLIAGKRYCFRGKFSDPTGNVSLNYNTTVCGTTPLTGLNQPRTPLAFGETRTTAASARTQR